MKSKKDYSILRQPISEENITQISELIVLRAIKTHCGYDHKFDKLYKGLLCDMFDKKKETFTFSDAYDLVQDVNIFLLSHVGRLVDEILYHDKKAILSLFARRVLRLLTTTLGYKLEILEFTAI